MFFCFIRISLFHAELNATATISSKYCILHSHIASCESGEVRQLLWYIL